MINSNPETVSTDYDTSGHLCFEPLTSEDVLAVVSNEKPLGVMTGFGGQTPLKLAHALVQEGVPLLGTNLEMIELAENREQFAALLKRLGLRSPAYGTATTVNEALHVAETLGYPVLVRPCYILGGRAVEIADTPEELRHYMVEAARISVSHPVLIDRFLERALEVDVDILTDGKDIWIAGLMEQIEEAGIHSGNSACVLPPVSLTEEMVTCIEDAAARSVRAMEAVGLINIQMAIRGTELFVLEANPRASRSVPFVSKAIGIPVAKLAAKALVGKPLRELLNTYWPFPVRPGLSGYYGSLEEILNATHLVPTPWPKASAVKEVVLPFKRFPGADVLLGPEMRSTGEVMSFGGTFLEAFAKSQITAGNPIPTEGRVLVSLADSDKREGVSLVSRLHD